MANFDRGFFGLFFPGLQAPPKKFTPKLVDIPLQFHFLEPKMFLTPIFCFWGGDQDVMVGPLLK